MQGCEYVSQVITKEILVRYSEFLKHSRCYLETSFLHPDVNAYKVCHNLEYVRCELPGKLRILKYH